MPLFEHTPHPHTPRNVNDLHKAEQATASFNDHLAVMLTKAVGTMTCAYCFALLAIVGFPGLHASPSQYVQWLSQTFIQLVMLSVIMVGQRVQGRAQEIQSEENYRLALKNEHDLAEIAKHQATQDAELIEQTRMIREIREKL